MKLLWIHFGFIALIISVQHISSPRVKEKETRHKIERSNMEFIEFISKVLNATEEKRKKLTEILKEYQELEHMSFSPGRKQHRWAGQGLESWLCEDASWLQLNGYNYIATEGLMDSILDFWKMIWHTDTKIIVMLCGLYGCSNYFPTDVGKTQVYGDYQVTFAQVKAGNDDFVEREIILKSSGPNLTKGNDTFKTVTHLHFKTWPDLGVPKGPKGITGFMEHVRECALQSPPESKNVNPRMVVHCTHGIGRTGTFLTAFNGLDRILSMEELAVKNLLDVNGALSLKDTVLYLRKTRHPWMVEGFSLCQYLMAYDIAIQIMKTNFKTPCGLGTAEPRHPQPESSAPGVDHNCILCTCL